MKARIAVVLLAIIACLILWGGYCFRARKPDKWSWDLIHNGKVYSHTQRKWVRYPMETQGDGWALKENLDAFHQAHGLPPIAWVDEPPNRVAAPGTNSAGFFSIPAAGISLRTTPDWSMTSNGGNYRIRKRDAEILVSIGGKSPEEVLRIIANAGDRQFLRSEPFVTKSGVKGIKGVFGSGERASGAVKYFLRNGSDQVVQLSVSCQSTQEETAIERSILETLDCVN